MARMHRMFEPYSPSVRKWIHSSAQHWLGMCESLFSSFGRLVYLPDMEMLVKVYFCPVHLVCLWCSLDPSLHQQSNCHHYLGLLTIQCIQLDKHEKKICSQSKDIPLL